MTRFKHITLALALAAIGGVSIHALAQSPAANTGTAATTAARPANKLLTFEQLERIAAREITRITEIEVKDLMFEAEGYNADGWKVEVVLDRRDGSVLSKKMKAPKHARYTSLLPGSN
mgnify:CR=1 FL=1